MPTLDDKMSFGVMDYVGYPYDEEWLAVNSPDEHICLLFQQIDAYIPPVWPNETGKQQQMMHLDFASK